MYLEIQNVEHAQLYVLNHNSYTVGWTIFILTPMFSTAENMRMFLCWHFCGFFVFSEKPQQKSVIHEYKYTHSDMNGKISFGHFRANY